MDGDSSFLALDIGEQRIGVARANVSAKIPVALVTLANDKDFNQELQTLIMEYKVIKLIAGLPRGLDGQDTAQTKYVKQFMNLLDLTISYEFQDEALTSVKAKEYLQSLKKNYDKSDIDKTAAMFILEDYLREMN